MSSSSVLVGSDASGAQVWVPKGIVASLPPPVPDTPAQVEDEPVDPPAPEAASDPVAPVPEVDTGALVDQARQEAYALGVADGKRHAEQAAQAERAALESLLKSITAQHQAVQNSAAEEVLSLALELTRVLTRHSVVVNTEAIVPVLRDAMLALPGLGQQIQLHLHPQDAALIKPLLAQDPTLSQSTWTVTEDARLERGGCRLETSHCEVDAALPTRWSRLVAALGREDSWHSAG